MAKVTFIPAKTPQLSAQDMSQMVRRRVAAYARVSTNDEEQLNSYENQVAFWTKYIQSRSDWECVKVFTDEGISAVNTKKRDGFNDMIENALAGNIDLIVTKSISRFARNTIDSLSTIRKLKDHGVEVWFEEQNIFTFDSKSELLISILSSLAQEESHNISENVKWSVRHNFSEGIYAMPYSVFLGYEKGEDGLPKIVPEQAETVRLIYSLYMEGKTAYAIANILTGKGIPTPAGKTKWHQNVIYSILANERYKGDARLQKQHIPNFLTKKCVDNNGVLPQFYVTAGHPAIIPPDEWDAVQAETQRRKNLGKQSSCTSPFASKIICGSCGKFYGAKKWHSTDKYSRTIYQCNKKFKNADKCKTPHLTEDEIKAAFLTAFNKLMTSRDSLIEDCLLAKTAVSDCTAIDSEIAKLQIEIEEVTELSKLAIYENAHKAVNQDEWQKRNDGYLERYDTATKRVGELEKEKETRLAKGKVITTFVKDIKSRPLAITEFDESLWTAVVESVTVAEDGKLMFRFKSGSEVAV
jgi:DNA invertase Pin-like site-specific DNA recombinase